MIWQVGTLAMEALVVLALEIFFTFVQIFSGPCGPGAHHVRVRPLAAGTRGGRHRGQEADTEGLHHDPHTRGPAGHNTSYGLSRHRHASDV